MLKTYKIVLVFLISMAILVSLVGCGTRTESSKESSNQQQQTKEESGTKVYKIGVSTQGWKNEFIKNLVDGFKEKDAQMDDVELIIVDSEDSIEKQLNDVDNLIAQKVDAIILDGNSLEGTSPAVDAANKANIPIVEVITYTKNENYNAFVGTDVKSSGIMAGEFIAKVLNGKGNIAILEGMMGSSGQINRAAGIKEVLEKYPDIKILAQQTANWKKEEAMRITEDWLNKFPKIDLIVGHNDQMALGALLACEAAGRKEVKIVGIDGDKEALKAIKDGRMAATMLDDVKTEAAKAVDATVSILKGENVDKKIIVPYILVTKENVDQYLK